MKGFLKVLLYERWVEDWTELQHIDPHSYGHNSVSFSFSWAAQPGAWGPSFSGTWSSFQHLLSNCLGFWTATAQLGAWGPPLLGAGSLYHILSPTNSNFLCTELYCFTPTQFNLSTVKVILLIPSTRCTCYLHWCISYFDSSAGVNMQQKNIMVMHKTKQNFKNIEALTTAWTIKLDKFQTIKIGIYLSSYFIPPLSLQWSTASKYFVSLWGFVFYCCTVSSCNWFSYSWAGMITIYYLSFSCSKQRHPTTFYFLSNLQYIFNLKNHMNSS